MSTPASPPTGSWTLTAPESLVLLSGGNAPADAEVVRVALIDCVVRGLLHVEGRTVKGMFRPREEWHLVEGSGAAPDPLATVVAGIRSAPEVVDTEGRRGRTIAAAAQALRRSVGPGTFTDGHVLPALAAAGLVTDPRRARWFRTSRFTLTAAGEAAVDDGRRLIEQARAAVAAVPTDGDPDATREAQLAAATALGAAGTLVVAERDLLAGAADLRRQLADGGSGGDATFIILVAGTGDTGSGVEDGERLGTMFDAVDAGAFDAADGGGYGGDGGDGGGGGGGGGD